MNTSAAWAHLQTENGDGGLGVVGGGMRGGPVAALQQLPWAVSQLTPTIRLAPAAQQSLSYYRLSTHRIRWTEAVMTMHRGAACADRRALIPAGPEHVHLVTQQR